MTDKTFIHPTSIIDQTAEISDGVHIGPFCTVGVNVKIGSGTKLNSHVTIDDYTTVGSNNHFYQFCSIGSAPQDLSYSSEKTETIIGDNNVIREYVSIHRGTTKQNKITKVGSHCLIMAYAHLGHDVAVGDYIVIVNSVNLAGHVHVGDRCIISGGTNISQFVTIGRGSFIGGLSGVDRDIPPFCTAFGNRVRLKGINIVGLRRQGHAKQSISELVDFYRSIESSALSPRAYVGHQEMVEDYNDNDLATEFIEFLRKSEIGIAPFMG